MQTSRRKAGFLRVGIRGTDFQLPDYQITHLPNLFLPPPGIFPPFVANKALLPFDPCATLGSPLGHAWATQGPPKGHPNPIPIPKRRQHRQGGAAFGYALPASSQKLSKIVGTMALILSDCIVFYSLLSRQKNGPRVLLWLIAEY